jgi:hypothetical protein
VFVEIQQNLIIRPGSRVKNDFLFRDLMLAMISIKFRSMFRFVFLWMALAVLRASAGFSSIYAFGDGVCTTTAEPTGIPYYGGRYCNGRVWIEVMAKWQGVTYDQGKNISEFELDSIDLKNSANAFVQPPDAGTALFIVWRNDADFVNAIGADISVPYSNAAPWDALADQSIADHVYAIGKLHDKGAREFVMPNAVNVTSVPFYNDFDPDDRAYARARIIEYNAQFKQAMLGLMAARQGLKIHLPDTFTFFEQVLANPVAYGMINPSIEEGNAGGLDSGDPALAGAGAQYVFWDDYHPTAKFQMHLAAFIQQIISPVKVNSLSLSGGNVNLQVANIPLGRAGFVQGSANLQPPWAQDLAFTEPFVAGGSTTKTLIFPASGTKRFYRTGFPVVWTWP